VPKPCCPASEERSLRLRRGHLGERREYLRHLKGQGESLAQLKGLIGAGRCALLCYERDAADCHRSILCAELEKEGYVFTHLRPASPAKPARSSGAKLSDFA